MNNEKIKILLLSHDSDLQGAERCLLELVVNLDRNRFEPLVVLPWQGPLANKLKKAEIPYVICHIKPWIPTRKYASWTYPFSYARNLRARLWPLLHWIEKEDIDLVYSNTSTILEGALAACRAGIPHIWHIHEYLRDSPDLFTYLPPALIDRIVLACSERVITPSKALAEARFRGSSKVRVVPNGIDLSHFRAGDGKQVRQELGIPSEAPVITWIGAISKTKDPLTFARTAALVCKRQPKAHFLLAGRTSDPTLEEAIRHFVNQSGLNGCFHLLGFRNDAPNLLAAATVHVSTSIQESFARNLIEATASGKPVIATRCGGPEEIILDGETGLIVPPRQPVALAEALLTLLDNPELARRFGQAGRKRAEEKFTVQGYAHSISQIITELSQKTA